MKDGRRLRVRRLVGVSAAGRGDEEAVGDALTHQLALLEDRRRSGGGGGRMNGEDVAHEQARRDLEHLSPSRFLRPFVSFFLSFRSFGSGVIGRIWTNQNGVAKKAREWHQRQRNRRQKLSALNDYAPVGFTL